MLKAIALPLEKLYVELKAVADAPRPRMPAARRSGGCSWRPTAAAARGGTRWPCTWTASAWSAGKRRPEPTGNGKVDIHLKCGDKQGVIEVKSFVNAHQAKSDREKAAWYAKSLGLDNVTLVMFVSVGMTPGLRSSPGRR